MLYLLKIRGIMNKLILTLIIFLFCSCGFDNYETPSGPSIYERYKEDQEQNKLFCSTHAEKDNRNMSYNYNYIPNEKYGIHITNGVYLANWHRTAKIHGVVVQFEFYFDSQNPNIVEYPTKFYITYRFMPVDTFFTDLWTDEIRMENNTLTEFIPREMTTSNYKLEILSLAVQESYCDSIVSSVYPDVIEYDSSPKYGKRKLWGGSIIVEGNNDYIRIKCEEGHACAGYVGGGAGTLCNDGWISGSTGSGTCSWHGGIRR